MGVRYAHLDNRIFPSAMSLLKLPSYFLWSTVATLKTLVRRPVRPPTNLPLPKWCCGGISKGTGGTESDDYTCMLADNSRHCNHIQEGAYTTVTSFRHTVKLAFWFTANPGILTQIAARTLAHPYRRIEPFSQYYEHHPLPPPDPLLRIFHLQKPPAASVRP